MKTLILQTDNSSDLKLFKELAQRLGVTYFETDNAVQENTVKDDFEEEIKKYKEKDNYTFEDIKEIATQFPKDYKWTYQDVVNYFPQDLSIKVEIINNQLFIMPTPNTTHQIISDELVFQFNLFIRKNKLGKVLAAPMDVKFDKDNIVQPDILFIAVSKYEIIGEKNIEGTPNLVVEIWSPSNKKKERDSKRELYQKNKVTEFWQIFPKKKQVRVEVLNEEGKYNVFSEAKEEGIIQSKVLLGFEMNVADIFED